MSRARVAAVIATVIILLILSLSYYFYTVLTTPFRGYSEPKLAVEIPPGKPLDWILRTLEERGVIRKAWPLRLVFRWRHTEGKSKAGEYVFDRPLSPLQVYEKLMAGEIQYTVLTVPEGSNVFDIGRILGGKGIGTDEEFRGALASQVTRDALRRIDPQITEAEGFLFPETYFLARGDGPQQVLSVMLREFSRRYGPAERRRAETLHRTTLEIVSLASLIEKETSQDSERELISGVFYNRLQKGMLLQCDPTVIYALLRNGTYRGEIYKSDLRFASPYNTYLHKGLPPAPICNPGWKSLQAALYPRETDKLYFVANNDGTHHFSVTLREHNAAVQKYRSKRK